jgi:hypothetical protein
MSTEELPTPKPSKIETTTASFVEEFLAQGNNVPTQIWQIIIMCKRRRIQSLGRSSSFDGTLLSFGSLIERTQDGDAE